MTEHITASPLCWPEGWKRTQSPVNSRFGKWNNKVSIDHEIACMESVLRTLQAVKRLQSMPQRIIASGETNGAVEWRDGLNEINDVLDAVVGQEQGGLF